MSPEGGPEHWGSLRTRVIEEDERCAACLGLGNRRSRFTSANAAGSHKDIENEDNLGEARGGAPNFFGSSARLPKIDKFKIGALECGGSYWKIRDSWPGEKND
jgi:hypothetical protein